MELKQNGNIHFEARTFGLNRTFYGIETIELFNGLIYINTS